MSAKVSNDPKGHKSDTNSTVVSEGVQRKNAEEVSFIFLYLFACFDYFSPDFVSSFLCFLV